MADTANNPVVDRRCEWVPATTAAHNLWVCQVCGAPVKVVVGDSPLAKQCSGHFGHFPNATSRAADTEITRLRDEVNRTSYAFWDVDGTGDFEPPYPGQCENR